MANTQTEELVWHKYPENPSPAGGSFLLQYKRYDYYDEITINKASPFYGSYRTEGGEIIEKEQVIAWAELPKGWIE